MPLTPNEIHWVAGLLEGEGAFMLTSPKDRTPKPKICVGSTDPDVLVRLQEVTGLGTIYGPYRVQNRFPNGKPIQYWTVSKQADAAALMMTLYPLMGERRKARIEEVLAGWRKT
jgi:hypothetical protein